MMRSRKRIILALISAITLVGAWGGRYYSARAHRAAEAEDVLPEFKELPPGARAPASAGFGAAVGRTSLEALEARIKERGLDCRDTSARALIREAREKKKAAAATSTAPVDATTSASSKKSSPMERNPQVRLSCENTEGAAIGDRERPASSGRLLYIFDSPKHPLRHASYRRVHKDHALARGDLLDSIAAMKAVYGEPTATSGALPAEGAQFGKYEPYKVEWIWTDVHVTVSALSYGERGVDVYEAIEVPWPVRTDRGFY